MVIDIIREKCLWSEQNHIYSEEMHKCMESTIHGRRHYSREMSMELKNHGHSHYPGEMYMEPTIHGHRHSPGEMSTE